MNVFKYLIINGFIAVTALAGVQFERLESLPQQLRNGVLRGHLGDGSLAKEIKLEGLELKPNGSGRYLVEIPDGHALYLQGMPVVPALTNTIADKEGFETEVALEVETVEKSKGSVPLKVAPLALVWSEDRWFPSIQTDGLYPGNFIKIQKSFGKTVAHIFPVQQDLKSGELIVLRSANLWVRYLPKSIGLERVKPSPRSLIVTSRDLKTSAEKLAQLQWETGKLQSQIVFVEDLKNEAMIAEDTLPDGYKNGDDKNDIVIPFDAASGEGYNYILARKIIHYLRDRFGAKGNALRYVTLLGDAKRVPPSYYFSLPATFGKKWGVTDQCYSSLENCLNPQVAIGRLPFSSNAEVENYIVKARAYAANSVKAKDELALVGGKAFPNSEVYVGELGTLRLIQDLQTDWFGVSKSYRTKFNYSRKKVLSLLSGESNARFVYALDHGKGNQWFVEHEFVSSDDIEKISATGNTPVVVSIACSNAAFDESIFKEPVFGNSKNGSRSIGTTLLASKAGAIAYWGEARPGLGNPIYDIGLNGNLELKGSTYGLQLLEGFFEKYRRARRGRMGDFVLQAQRAFSIESGTNMKEQANAWTYYITTLLGDPTLVLPTRPDETVESYPIGDSKMSFTKGNELPLLTFDKPMHFDAAFTSAKPVNATLFQWVETEFGAFMAEKVLGEKKDVSGDQSLPLELLPEDSYGTYFMRLENTRGVPRERQIWFRTQK